MNIDKRQQSTYQNLKILKSYDSNSKYFIVLNIITSKKLL